MRTRISGFDWLRVIAAFTIVAFHIVPYTGVINELALSWALPFFFALSGYLNGLSRTYTEAAWLRSRLTRLAIPYVIWTTLRLVDLRPINALTLAKQYLLCAPTSTLWFLWTLMLCVTVVWLGRRMQSTRQVFLASVYLGLAYMVLCEWWQSFGVVGAWLHANPGYALQVPLLWLWVYAGGMWLSEQEDLGPWLAPALLAVGFAIMVLWRVEPALGYNYSWGFQGLAHGLLGLGAVALGRTVAFPSSPWIETLATASLGVYLIHPALIRVIHMNADTATAIGWVSGHAWAMWLLVSVASAALAVALERGRLTRWIVA